MLLKENEKGLSADWRANVLVNISSDLAEWSLVLMIVERMKYIADLEGCSKELVFLGMMEVLKVEGLKEYKRKNFMEFFNPFDENLLDNLRRRGCGKPLDKETNGKVLDLADRLCSLGMYMENVGEHKFERGIGGLVKKHSDKLKSITWEEDHAS